MGNKRVREPAADPEWYALLVGLLALGIAEWGRRRVWLSFNEVSFDTADPFTGRELPETASLPTIALVGLAVSLAIFVVGLIASKSAIRRAAGLALALSGGSLFVATSRAVISLPSHSVVADGYRAGPIVAVVAAAVVFFAGLALARPAHLAKNLAAVGLGAAAGSAAIGFLAPLSTPVVEPEVVEGFAFHTGPGSARTGARAADTSILARQLVIIDGEPVLVRAGFWQIDDGRFFRVHELTDSDGTLQFGRKVSYLDGRIYVGLIGVDDESLLRVLSADDYSTVGTIELGRWSLLDVTSEGTVVVAGPGEDDRIVHRPISNVEQLLAGDASELEFGAELPQVKGRVLAIDERNGEFVFVVDSVPDVDLWSDGSYFRFYDSPDTDEVRVCAGIELPEGTNDFSRLASFDAAGRVLVSYERFDESLDRWVTDLYVADLNDGSIRVITLPVWRIRSIAADEGAVFVSAEELVEIVDYEATLAAAPVLDHQLTRCGE